MIACFCSILSAIDLLMEKSFSISIFVHITLILVRFDLVLTTEDVKFPIGQNGSNYTDKNSI